MSLSHIIRNEVCTSLMVLLAFFCVAAQEVSARSIERRDTLMTRTGDNVIIPYEYKIEGNRLVINIKPSIICLRSKNLQKYSSKAEYLTVVIFDRKGSFVDAQFSGDVTPEVFTVPSELMYTVSREGYYLLHDNPNMTFHFRDNSKEAKLSFPAFLAYHERKGRYRLIARCGTLEIDVTQQQMRGGVNQQMVGNSNEISSVEIESDNSDITRVLECIANINERLPMEDRLPMTESLEGDVRLLREWKYTVSDPLLKEKVNETLDAYEQKKRELENANAAAVQAQQRKAEEEIKAMNEAEKERQKEETEKNQKRTIWLAIGGAFLAICAFVGNHFLHSYRNKKSQRNMMELQQSMIRRAENATKRRINSKTRSIVVHTTNKVRGNAQRTFDKNAAKIAGKIKNKKNVSI